MTVAGTRPELIRLSQIIPRLDAVCEHSFIYTGQNYDKNLKDIFFDSLNIREPEIQADNGICSSCTGISDKLHLLMSFVETAIEEIEPDKILILGDTDSSLAATMIAEKKGIPVYHMEAGNRCWDKEVPEEVNRRMIDSIASFNMPYTEKSAQNLYREGHHPSKVFVCGNPIFEVITKNINRIDECKIRRDLGIYDKFIVATFHRQENVDNQEKLERIVYALETIGELTKIKIIVSTHPRTRDKLLKLAKSYAVSTLDEMNYSDNLVFIEPVNFFQFCSLEKNAEVVITDSGTVQEEACIFGTPTVTIRNSTERPETVETGSNIVTIVKSLNILEAFEIAMKMENGWKKPAQYSVPNVSQAVVNYILGNQL